MLIVHFDLQLEFTCPIDRYLAAIATITPVRCDSSDINSVNALPVLEMLNTNRTGPIVMVLEDSLYIYLISMTTARQIVLINVH
jgi:hypothetical protein